MVLFCLCSNSEPVKSEATPKDYWSRSPGRRNCNVNYQPKCTTVLHSLTLWKVSTNLQYFVAIHNCWLSIFLSFPFWWKKTIELFVALLDRVNGDEEKKQENKTGFPRYSRGLSSQNITRITREHCITYCNNDV
jgi:hypothetical protein